MSTAITPAEQAPETSRTLVQRLPTSAFITLYGIILIAMVVAVALLMNYNRAGAASPALSAGTTTATNTATAAGENAETASVATPAETTPKLPEPLQPWNPPPVDEANVLASVRSHLIKDVQTAPGTNGVYMRGTIPGDVEKLLPELSGHLKRLLEQNCIQALTLTTDDNLRLSFYGFCYSTLPETAIADLTTIAADADAEALIFTDTHSPDGIEADLNWLNAEDDELAALETTWKGITRPAGISRMRFAAYGEEEGAFAENGAGKKPKVWRNPVGYAVVRNK